MNFCNRKGIFSNKEDTTLVLQTVLGQQFENFSITQHGAVAIFEAENL
jgi:hypothetical protein